MFLCTYHIHLTVQCYITLLDMEDGWRGFLLLCVSFVLSFV